MDYLFANLVLGHLVGDYLLQTKHMALNKSQKTPLGFFICFIHCTIYTVCIILFIGNYEWNIVLLIFLSHFPFDYWSLGDKWLKLIKGRNMLVAYNSKEPYHEIDLIFSCIVYTVVDNTFHLMLMFFILK